MVESEKRSKTNALSKKYEKIEKKVAKVKLIC